jgi:hypothetical protein
MAVGTKIEAEICPRVEAHSVKGFVKRSGIVSSEAVTVSAERPREYDLQSVRAIGEIIERLGVRFASVGMIDPRNDTPRALASNSALTFRRPIDRFDPNAIRSPGEKRFNVRAAKRCFSRFAPIGLGTGGKEASDSAHADPR